MARINRSQARLRRHRRVRRKVSGSAARPRLNVFRSINHIYAQLIDDEQGHTLVAASTQDPKIRAELSDLDPQAQARHVGKVLAERAQGHGIRTVVFDRGGYPFHGRVKAVAEGSREAGLIF